MGNESFICGSCVTATIENDIVINIDVLNSAAIKAPDDEGAEDATVSAVTCRNNSVLIDAGAAISIGSRSYRTSAFGARS